MQARLVGWMLAALTTAHLGGLAMFGVLLHRTVGLREAVEPTLAWREQSDRRLASVEADLHQTRMVLVEVTTALGRGQRGIEDLTRRSGELEVLIEAVRKAKEEREAKAAEAGGR